MVFWDPKKLQPRTAQLAFLPIHETLDQLVTPGSADVFTSLGPEQEFLRPDFSAWSGRTKIELQDDNWTCIGIWGDSAPVTTVDNVFLITCVCAFT